MVKEKFKRNYNSLRFFYNNDKQKKLLELSDKNKDFEFRRLFIEISEEKLHVIFSWKTIFKYLAIILLFLSLIVYRADSNLFISLFSFSVTLKLVSDILWRKYKKCTVKVKFNLFIVDSVIFEQYGIKLPEWF